MLDRLLGQETEYAIRFAPQGGSSRPGHELIFEAVAYGVTRLVPTRPGERYGENGQIFVANGGAIYYEALPYAVNDGLIEASTPECRGPGELLLYQRAQQALLLEALPLAESHLAMRGFRGKLSLIKNCRDAEGHIYGAQENYEVTVGSGPTLWAYRLALGALVPLVVVVGALNWALLPLLIALMILFYAVAGTLLIAVPPWRRRVAWLFDFDGPRAPGTRLLGYVLYYTQYILTTPLLFPFSLILRLFAFRRIRRELTPFIVSRPILAGAGTLVDDATFALSEKGTAVNRVMRWGPSPHSHALYDTGNLLKDLFAPATLRFGGLARLFRRRQRMQLGVSEANAAQVAEYLKVGTTCLVLDMIEQGFLRSPPKVRRPVKAMRALGRDLTGKERVARNGSHGWSALELQRYYLGEAQRFLRESPTPSLEAKEIVRLWEEALDALDSQPGRLVGRLDWVTKRYLLATAGADLDADGRKKIDLRYHELGNGYLARMEEAGVAVTLVSPEEIKHALTQPPSTTPARIRGRMIQELAASEAEALVSWDSIRIGGRLRGKVIRLADRRGRPPEL